MALILCGKTCSGKTTILEQIVKYFGMKRMVSYTTRPMRKDEVDGVTYHFISKEEFEQKINNRFFLEYTSYKVANGEIWYYGSPKNEFSDSTVAIFNPEGVRNITKTLGKDVVIYLKCKDSILSDRLTERGDNWQEAERRLLADRKDFAYFELGADFTLRNDLGISVSEMAKIIYELYIGVTKNE